jgi:hypothetical protein
MRQYYVFLIKCGSLEKTFIGILDPNNDDGSTMSVERARTVGTERWGKPGYFIGVQVEVI